MSSGLQGQVAEDLRTRTQYADAEEHAGRHQRLHTHYCAHGAGHLNTLYQRNRTAGTVRDWIVQDSRLGT